MTKIMIVDDNVDIVETLKLVVDNLGFEHAEAYSGDELIEHLPKENPDLILLDVMMPGMKLQETLQHIQEHNKDNKVILITVIRFMDEEKEKILANEIIKDYVVKPFDVMDLQQRIKTILGL